MYYYIKPDSDGAKYFKINSQTGEIGTKAVFDRETKGAYALEVEARDGAPSARPNSGGQPNSVTKYIRIGIADKNDNPPYFDKHLYEAEVDENEDIQHTVLTVTANDKDECKSGFFLQFCQSEPEVCADTNAALFADFPILYTDFPFQLIWRLILLFFFLHFSIPNSIRNHPR